MVRAVADQACNRVGVPHELGLVGAKLKSVGLYPAGDIIGTNE